MMTKKNEITKKGNFRRERIKKIFENLIKERRLEKLWNTLKELEKKRDENPSLIMEFIGLRVKIVRSSSTFEGKEGYILWETRNTFKILTLHKKKSYDIIDIPKKGNVFELSLKGERFKIIGDKIAYSPIERAKRLRSWRI